MNSTLTDPEPLTLTEIASTILDLKPGSRVLIIGGPRRVTADVLNEIAQRIPNDLIRSVYMAMGRERIALQNGTRIIPVTATGIRGYAADLVIIANMRYYTDVRPYDVAAVTAATGGRIVSIITE